MKSIFYNVFFTSPVVSFNVAALSKQKPQCRLLMSLAACSYGYQDGPMIPDRSTASLIPLIFFFCYFLEASFTMLQPQWPPCFPWTTLSMLQPQGLCTCYYSGNIAHGYSFHFLWDVFKWHLRKGVKMFFRLRGMRTDKSEHSRAESRNRALVVSCEPGIHVLVAELWGMFQKRGQDSQLGREGK